MAMVDLEGVYKVTAKGKTYYYAWRGKGAPRLEAEPGTAEFLEELREARSSRKAGDRTRLSGLCAMYRSSDAWLVDISAKTRASWTTWLDRIQAEFGELRLEQFDRPQMRPIIKRWRDRYKATPRAADMGLQVFSRLLSFGMEEGKLLGNIVVGISRLYDGDRSDLIWRADDFTALEPHASPEVMQAAMLGALTGLRQTDLLRLSWSHVKANSIEVRTGKSGGRKTTLIPIYTELRDYLAELKPARATTLLVNTDGRPWRTGFGSSWGRAVKAAKLELHFHDLRGTAATKFYLGGLSIREIAQIMTWSEDRVEYLINTYVKKDELLLDRIRRMDENAPKTGRAKPHAKPAP